MSEERGWGEGLKKLIMPKSKEQVDKKIEVWSRDKTPEAILGFSREMRKDPTKAEALLWESLRGRNLNKLKFRRQQPIKGYILDFYCEEIRLGVEVDGEIHLKKDKKSMIVYELISLQSMGLK